MIFCLDTLAGNKYPDVIMRTGLGTGIGLFWDTFGPAEELIKREAKRKRSIIRVQGIWKDDHNFTDADATKAILIGKKLYNIATSYPKTKFFYSPFCEHKKDKKFMSSLFSKLKTLPNLTLVNSPIKGGEWIEGVVNEIHHNDKPAGMPKGEYIFSFDGLNCVDANFEEWKTKYSSALLFFAWVPQFNLKKSMKDETPRKLRKCKPTLDLINSLLFVGFNKKLEAHLADGWICKSHSEQHENLDPRANKLVLVGPKGEKQFRVTINGQPLKDGGWTEDKRNTWRSAKAGYRFPRSSKIIANGKLIGVVDPAWRENEWRNVNK